MIDQIVQHHKPLAYILGSQPFYPLPVDLLVKPPILVPRPETEHWVLHLSQTILSSPSFRNSTSSPAPGQNKDKEAKFRILDIGTGSGCIALGLTQSLLHPDQPHVNGTSKPERGSGERTIETVAIDQSNFAVELAKENSQRCQLEERVSVHQLDLFSDSFTGDVKRLGNTSEGEGFDLVVSNPPYITREEFEGLDLSVKNWEDRKALVGEVPHDSGVGEEAEGVRDDGLIFYKRITSILEQLLRPGNEVASKQDRPPNIAFEVGKGQAQEVGKMLRTRGYKAEIVSDPWGVERAVFGWKP
ncbi:hypothetical protein JCM3765_005323 [Sporobolomyces pararoseus]